MRDFRKRAHYAEEIVARSVKLFTPKDSKHDNRRRFQRFHLDGKLPEQLFQKMQA